MNKKYIFAYKLRETLAAFLSKSIGAAVYFKSTLHSFVTRKNQVLNLKHKQLLSHWSPSLSHQVWQGRLVLGALLVATLACSHGKEKPEVAQHPLPVVNPEVSSEVSLKEDRAQLAEMRKEVPEEKKQENDELALILQTMKSDTYLGQDKDPHKVREDFDHILRKRRSKFDQEVQKLRDDYNKAERKNREEFTKSQQDERAEFLKKKAKAEERKEFYEEQDGKRKEYFANEKEKRAEFESSMTEKRRNYEDHVREVSNKFNQEHKAYTRYYHERKKAEGVMQRVQDRARAKGHLPSQQSGAMAPAAEPSSQTPATPLRSGDADSN